MTSAEELAKHFLASLELTYYDELGTMNFEPKMIQPQVLGRIETWATTLDGGLSFMTGGSRHEPSTINLGPITLPAGSQNVTVEICNIAPETFIQVHEIQIRMQPID